LAELRIKNEYLPGAKGVSRHFYKQKQGKR
jgi:hypothetical protein